MKKAILALLFLPLGGTLPLQGDDITTEAAPAAPTILVPAVHPDQDLSHMDNLKMSTSARLYYCQDTSSDDSQPQDADENSSNDIPTATIHVPEMNYPVVQLENSQYIATFLCSASQATITFSNKNAFQTALANWRKANEFIIIAYDPSCGDVYEKNERNFILVTEVSADDASLTITAQIQHLTIEDAIGGDNPIHVDVGSWTPSTPDGYPDDGPSDDQASKRSTAYTKDYSGSVSLNSFPTNAQSPWGSAYSIYNNAILTAYCVNCGVSGQLTLKGSFSLTLFGGLKTGNLLLSGSLHAGLQLGLVASTISKTLSVPELALANVPLSPLTIAGIVTIGPNLALRAGASLTVTASGNLRAGATLDWPAIAATLDLSQLSKSTASGFSPQLTPVLQAQGNISATAAVYLVVRFECGVSILNGKFSKSVALVEKPGVSVTAKAAGGVSVGSGGVGGGSAAAPCNVDVSAGLTNDVYVDLAGVKEVGIASWKSTVLDKCVA